MPNLQTLAQFYKRPLVYVVACIVVVLVLSAGAALASQDLLPGDTLYPLKQLTEKVKLALVSPEESKTKADNIQANEQLGESVPNSTTKDDDSNKEEENNNQSEHNKSNKSDNLLSIDSKINPSNISGDDDRENSSEDEDGEEDDDQISVINSSPTPAPAPTPAPNTAPTPTPTGYTIAQVKMHATATSCWSVVNNSVYNLTSWISAHPGGSQAILSLCGADGSAAFNAQHGGQTKATNALASFRIGALIK